MGTIKAIRGRLLQLCDGPGITLREFFGTEGFDNLKQEIK